MTTDTLNRRAALHRALGDPLRLAIVDALALSDYAPSELEALLDVPSNLLAHHLATLEAAGVIDRLRSSGDGRRRYLRLRPEAAALASPPALLNATRVLFVCTGNSARSPLAEALWATVSVVPGASAGTQPAASTHPLAVEAARAAGLKINHLPQAVDEARRPGDLIVTVCDQAHEAWGAAQRARHWSIPDPARSSSPAVFAQTLETLRARVVSLAQFIRPMHLERTR